MTPLTELPERPGLRLRLRGNSSLLIARAVIVFNRLTRIGISVVWVELRGLCETFRRGQPDASFRPVVRRARNVAVPMFAYASLRPDRHHGYSPVQA